MTTQSPMVRCERCHKVRDRPGSPWSDHPAKIPGEVLGVCRTCADLWRLLLKRKWDDEGRKLLQDRKRGYGSLTPVADVFKGFRSEEPKGEEVKIGAAFPGSYLKAADLQGKRVTVTIERVDMEDIGGDQKPVAHFRGKDRGLVLNKTNGISIQMIAGTDETDEWDGTVVVLFPSKTEFQGKRVDCIRIDPPDTAPPPRRRPEPETIPDDDDSVPF